MTDQSLHVPVLLDEALESLAISAGSVVVDGTLGGGGHTMAIAERVGPAGLVISLDRDVSAIDRFEERRGDLPIRLGHANFSHLPEVLEQLEMTSVDAVLLDLGLSSDQLADDDRGFSFHSPGPLDLRFDISEGEPAWRLLERLSQKHIADLLFTFGEERLSRRIATRIVQQRGQQPLKRAVDFASLVTDIYPSYRREKIHPATRFFQALRIAVNEELRSLETALRRIPECISPGGRFCVISFHSLEDRRVKHSFRDDTRLLLPPGHSLTASEEELARNPRSRSARLRTAQRCAVEES